METKTGFGYIKNDKDQITDKFVLPKGQHPDVEGMTYHDVDNKKALEDVIIFKKPKTQEEIDEEKIIAEGKLFVREEAIKRLEEKETPIN